MIRNYFVIATRNLLHSKLYSSINIVGLSIGIACCLLLTLFVLDEFSYDKYNKNAAGIFRVVNLQKEGSRYTNMALTQGVLGPELARNFGDIKEATRVIPFQRSLHVEGKEPVEGKILAVDPSYLSIFTLPFKTDSGKKELISSKGIAISESAAIKLFGKTDPVGQTISVAEIGELKVTGVFYDFPVQAHVRGDYLISFSWIEKSEPLSLSWSSNSYYTYVWLREETDVAVFNEKMNTFVHQYIPATWKSYEYFLQPLVEIHMDDTFHSNASPAIGKKVLIPFVTMGIIILLLACFNYMNMATAKSARRALEVGVRKVMGAHRAQLIGQFLGESFILCTLSFLLAILWVDLTLPVFNSFLSMPTVFGNRNLSMDIFFADYRLLVSLIGCMIFLSIVAGSYPAFFLSKFLPVTVLKSRHVSDTSRRMRRSLVLVQFVLTTVLLVMALVVYRQTGFMKTKDLGFNKDRLILFSAVRNTGMSLPVFKTELQKIAGVKQITSVSSLPGRSTGSSEIRPYNSTESENIRVGWISVDHDYIPTLQLTLLAGRNFDANGTDGTTGVIINEMAAQALGCYPAEKAIGKPLSGFIFSDSLRGEVIGVVKDYHVNSLRREISPMVLAYGTDNNRYMVRIEGPELSQVREQINASVRKLMPDKPFESMVIDEYMDNVYLPEEKTGELLTFFAFLAISIGCLGLYALSAYEGEQRTKELGLRKIMGATSLQLLTFLSRGFMKLVLISLFIAMPLAYFLATAWLHSFPYHISLSGSVFIQSALSILLLSWFTIASHAMKAAGLNPVDALRHE
jgi:ABC-type antimicrobial peptide transport system permease subunit